MVVVLTSSAEASAESACSADNEASGCCTMYFALVGAPPDESEAQLPPEFLT